VRDTEQTPCVLARLVVVSRVGVDEDSDPETAIGWAKICLLE